MRLVLHLGHLEGLASALELDLLRGPSRGPLDLLVHVDLLELRLGGTVHLGFFVELVGFVTTTEHDMSFQTWVETIGSNMHT